MLRLLRLLALVTTISFTGLTIAGIIAMTSTYYSYMDDASLPSTPASSNSNQFIGPVKFDPQSRSLVQIYVESSADVTVADGAGEKVVELRGKNFLCSGFFADTIGTIATADHCIGLQTIADAITEPLITDGKAIRHVQFTSLIFTGIQNASISKAALRQPSTLTILEAGSIDSDEAILRADHIARPSVPLPFASHKPAIGEIVRTIGYPGESVRAYMEAHKLQTSVETLDHADLQATVVESSVTGSTRGASKTPDSAVGAKRIGPDETKPGMSGGPTVNAAGEVVGVHSCANHSVGTSCFTKLDNLRAKLDRLHIQVTYNAHTASEQTAHAPEAFDIIVTAEFFGLELREMLAATVASMLLMAAIRPFRQRRLQPHVQQAVPVAIPVTPTHLRRAS